MQQTRVAPSHTMSCFDCATRRLLFFAGWLVVFVLGLRWLLVGFWFFVSFACDWIVMSRTLAKGWCLTQPCQERKTAKTCDTWVVDACKNSENWHKSKWTLIVPLKIQCFCGDVVARVDVFVMCGANTQCSVKILQYINGFSFSCRGSFFNLTCHLNTNSYFVDRIKHFEQFNCHWMNMVKLRIPFETTNVARVVTEWFWFEDAVYLSLMISFKKKTSIRSVGSRSWWICQHFTWDTQAELSSKMPDCNALEFNEVAHM